MADITLKENPTETISTGATVKTTPLSILEVDDNFNNLNTAVNQAAIAADEALAGAVALAIALG